jgi:molecular chaperone DnaK (HSP70)
MESVPGSAVLGIDFGTTYSAMSWYDPKTNEAKIIPNLDGEAKTPSAVYFGAHGVSVGTPALNEFMDAMQLGEADAAARYVGSIKRNLLVPPVISIAGGRTLRPVEVVAEILRKLKHDAEDGHFREGLAGAVVTVPAAFDAEQRGVIQAAANRAGFQDVTLLEEPVAAAMAFAGEGQKVGNSILVYDLGGGTFDLAVLTRTGDGQLAVALPPAGDAECGGDDFDKTLYDYCNGQYGVSDGAGIDVPFLHLCRAAKEKLSTSPRAVVSRILNRNPQPLAITRECFEGLIRERVDRTMRRTAVLLERAQSVGCKVDTVVLVGGSTRIPLVMQELKATLARSGTNAEPLKYANQDVAVALGASEEVALKARLTALPANNSPIAQRSSPPHTLAPTSPVVPAKNTAAVTAPETSSAKPAKRVLNELLIIWSILLFGSGIGVMIGGALRVPPLVVALIGDVFIYLAIKLLRRTWRR